MDRRCKMAWNLEKDGNRDCGIIGKRYQEFGVVSMQWDGLVVSEGNLIELFSFVGDPNIEQNDRNCHDEKSDKAARESYGDSDYRRNDHQKIFDGVDVTMFIFKPFRFF